MFTVEHGLHILPKGAVVEMLLSSGGVYPPPPPSWGRTPKHRSCAVESLPKETSVVGKLSIPSRGETEEFSAPEKLGNSSVLDIG